MGNSKSIHRCFENFVVTTCVMNQSWGHWLLSNGHNTCISLTLTLEDIRQVINVLNALNAFDVELLIFQNNMQAKVVKATKPFL